MTNPTTQQTEASTQTYPITYTTNDAWRSSPPVHCYPREIAALLRDPDTDHVTLHGTEHYMPSVHREGRTYIVTCGPDRQEATTIKELAEILADYHDADQ